MPVLNKFVSGGDKIEGVEYQGIAKVDISKNELCCIQGSEMTAENINHKAVFVDNTILAWLKIDEERVLYITTTSTSSTLGTIYAKVVKFNDDEVGKFEKPFLDTGSSDSTLMLQTYNPNSTLYYGFTKINYPNIYLFQADDNGGNIQLYFIELTNNNNSLKLALNIPYTSVTESEYKLRQILEVNYNGYVNDGTFYDFYEFRNNDSSNMTIQIVYSKVSLADKVCTSKLIYGGKSSFNNLVSNLIYNESRNLNKYYLLTRGFATQTVNGVSTTIPRVAIDLITLPKIDDTSGVGSLTNVYNFDCDGDTAIPFYSIGDNNISLSVLHLATVDSVEAWVIDSGVFISNAWFELTLPHRNRIVLNNIDTVVDIDYLRNLLAYNNSFLVMYGNTNQGRLNPYRLFLYGIECNQNISIQSNVSIADGQEINYYKEIQPTKLNLQHKNNIYVLGYIEKSYPNKDMYCKVIEMNAGIFPLTYQPTFYSSQYVGLAKDNYKAGELATIIHPVMK